jgi:LacI family transcriptional regulator
LELGFKLEDFWLGEPDMTPRRFAQILASRGINGLLIGRLPPGQSELNLPWESFACVALGLTLKSPRLHHVAEDAFASAADAMNRCFAAGYRRVGFVFSEPDDSPNTGDRYLGAYFRHQELFSPENRIPHCGYRPMPEFAAHFLSWMKTHKPDVVLATHVEPIVQLYANLGLIFPPKVKLVALVNDKLHHGFAGIYHDPAELGALAVDLVVGMLHRGETGVPRVAHYVLVPGRWEAGTGSPGAGLVQAGLASAK